MTSDAADVATVIRIKECFAATQRPVVLIYFIFYFELEISCVDANYETTFQIKKEKTVIYSLKSSLD